MKLYNELASWWPLLSAPEDYAEEAAFFSQAIREACTRKPKTLLELGSGGGNNAFHMKHAFQLTLVDLSGQMLGVSRELNPECRHIQGDMRTARLQEQFDCVFVHDAVVYMTTEEDLRAVMQTAFVHCKPGGAALFAPDHVRENFKPSTEHGGHDDGKRGLRYLAWTWQKDLEDATYIVDYACLLREADGSTRSIQDRHVEGLFSRGTWLRWLEETGFIARKIQFDHSELEPGSYEIFVASKPG